MANTKISSLATANAVTDTTMVPVVDGSTTKKVTGAQLKTHAQSGLATVATTGSYTDMSDKPTIPDGTYGNLTGKPNLFSGSYTDLTGKPNTLIGLTAAGGINPTLTEVTLDNIKIRYTTSTDNQYTYAQISTVTSSITMRIGQGSNSISDNATVTTSWSILNNPTGYNLSYSTFTLFDITNNKTYRVTLMILDGNIVPPGRLANTKQMILIERLV